MKLVMSPALRGMVRQFTWHSSSMYFSKAYATSAPAILSQASVCLWAIPLPKKTISPDVVLRNDIGDIIAVYDVKTGDEGLDRARRAALRAATGVDRSVPIIELRVCNDPIDCTYAKTWWD